MDWEEHTSRTWTPMDGVEPPHCPFDDRTTWVGVGRAGDGRPIRVVVELHVVHWSPDVVNSATAGLSIGGPSPDEPGHPPLVGVSLFGTTGAGRSVHTLRLRGRGRDRAVVVVDRLVERLGADG